MLKSQKKVGYKMEYRYSQFDVGKEYYSELF